MIVFPGMFKTVRFIIFALLVILHVLCAQNAVTVERVKFDSLGDDWMQIEIQLVCNGSMSPDARNPDFVENITIKPLIVYSKGRNFHFYTASVEVMIMEARDKSSVYFYMPGLVVERDELPSRPGHYYIEISIDGVIQDPSDAGEALSSSIRGDLESLKNMQTRANSQAQSINNEGLLLPAYFAPREYSSGARNQPVYKRREPNP